MRQAISTSLHNFPHPSSCKLSAVKRTRFAPLCVARTQVQQGRHAAPYTHICHDSFNGDLVKRLDVIRGMDQWAEDNLLRYLKPVDKCWQPSDLLPDPASTYFEDEVRALQRAAAALPNDLLVVLVGDMVTEEALPSYMNMLNITHGIKDETGAQSHPWAVWNRAWTAEENRHGELLNKYLYLCGRVDMRSIEVSTQNLIGNGLEPKLDNNPYYLFVYTSFQERATKLSHGNTARLAGQFGDEALATMCGLIAADEARHEAAYQAIVGELFRRDPEGAMLAFAAMMKRGITMPAHLMDDNWHRDNNARGASLFKDYAAVAEALGVYQTEDYAQIIEHLVEKWDVGQLSLSGEAAAAQEYVMLHPERIRRLADLQMERRLRDRKARRNRTAFFSWVGKREVELT